MTYETNTEFTTPESIDDLQCLMRGDLVKLVFEYVPTWKYGQKESVGTYHGINSTNGHLLFLIQESDNHLLMHSSRKSEIGFHEGQIVLNEDTTSTKSYTPRDEQFSEYKFSTLCETLQQAGIRK